MTREAPCSEIIQIQQEYETFFHSLTPLVQNKVEIITFEKTRHIAEFTTSGWLINDKLYETFESGAGEISVGFKNRFHEVLCKKLEGLKGLEN